MYLRFGDEVDRDEGEAGSADFYARLVRGRAVASTSSPSPGDFLASYERAGDPDIVCVTVSAAMSAGNHEAKLAAERFGGRVEVVDSKSASMAEGFCAIEAARAAAAGASLDDAASRARDIADRTTLLATVETFEYLKRSGRVTKLQAYAATMLDIKPVFVFRGGDVSPVARTRTKRRAVARVLEETLEAIDARPAHLAVVHAAAREDAERLAEAIRAAADVVECHVVEVTPVIGAHTGPGLVGTAFYVD